MDLPYRVFVVLVFLYLCILPVQIIIFSKFRKANDVSVLGSTINPLKLFVYWLVLHIAIFIIRDVWILYALVILIGFFSRLTPDQRMFLFAYLLFSIPMYFAFIPGFAGINNFLRVDFAMVLGLAILGPAYLKIRHQQDYIKFGKLLADKCVFIIILLIVFNSYRETLSLTIVLKEIIVVFSGIFIPYVVISRRVRINNNFDIFLLMVLFIGLYQALITAFEFITSWRLYNATDSWIGAHGGMLRIRYREGYIRATSIFSQAIISGYFMMLFFSIYIYLYKKINLSVMMNIGVTLLLLLALYSSSSRAPWVGTLLFVFLFMVVFSNAKARNFIYLSVAGVVTVLGLVIAGQIDRFIGLLPWFNDEQQEVMYRVRLIEQSWKVIKENPILGEPQNIFLKRPEMLEMVQGEGIVDLVNSYLAILLYYGVVGLIAHLLILYIPLRVFYKSYKFYRSNRLKSDLASKFSFLFSIIVIHVFVVSTVSSIGHLNTFVYVLYALVTGMCVLAFDEVKAMNNARVKKYAS